MQVYKVHNGPFDSGIDSVLVEAPSQKVAEKGATQAVEDFTAYESEEMPAMGSENALYRADHNGRGGFDVEELA